MDNSFKVFYNNELKNTVSVPFSITLKLRSRTRSGLKTDTSQMTPIFSLWQGELSEGIAQLFRGQINATSGEKRKADEVVRF